MHAHFENTKRLADFVHRFLSVKRVVADSPLSITSDSPEFYKYIDQISDIYFNAPGFSKNISNIHCFLILIHDDRSIDIYINDFTVAVQLRLKGDLEGSLIKKDDIADIQKLGFPQIEIQDSDTVICCLKVGWKFLLYCDLLSEGRKLDIASMRTELGRLYRYLCFQEVYQTLETETCFKEMVADGWFPFIEVLGKDYEELATIYQDGKSACDHVVKTLLDRFDESRLRGMTDKWWGNPLFQKKRKLLQAGVDAFLGGTESDYINCIKNLYTEIEGIMRALCFKDTQKRERSTQKLIEYLITAGEHAVEDDHSLLLPRFFSVYLTECIFKHFDLTTDMVDLSRHSIAHGAAEGKDYTSERALQGILTLDQIYFYIS